MAQKKKPTKKSRSRSSRSVSSKGSGLNRLKAFLSKGPVLLLVIVLFGAAGTYLLVDTYALPPFGRDVPANDAARGLNYNGLKRDESGPCGAEGFKVEKADEHADHACTHPDPGPKGIDVRERAKHVDKILSDQAEYDATYLPDGEDATIPKDTPPLVTVDATITGYDLREVAPVNWPCIGAGNEGARVQWVYVYRAGAANRLNDLRSGLVTIAKRTNAVVYNSSMDNNGTPQRIRYLTNSACGLAIGTARVSGDINNFGNVKTQLRALGFNRADRKYVLSIDGGSACGKGDLYAQDIPDPSNRNNHGDMFAAIWKPCWNYGEPHELGHMLGAVQNTAPYSTAGFHCRQENDVMCYDDGTARSNMIVSCVSAARKWKFDCGFNDYHDRGTSSGYISTHWNIAKNKFLTR